MHTQALVVGGTGMLRGVCLWLAGEGRTVTVIGRRAHRLGALVRAAEGFPGRIVPLTLDYRDTRRLRAGLSVVQGARGPVGLAVCWIHAVAPEAPLAVADAVGGGASPVRYFHVAGSARTDPSRRNPVVEEVLARHPSLLFREVVLGFRVENGSSRWLTDAEISQGVVEAIGRDAARSIVGVVEPWSMRPGGKPYRRSSRSGGHDRYFRSSP